jgi:thymidine kinase
MFSGKTEELIRLVRRAMHAQKKVQVFKSSLDTRCETTVIRTHDGVIFNAQAVPDTKTMEGLIEAATQVVGIEEVQFFDDAVVAFCQRLADSGVEVIVAGLDMDFRGLPFSFMPTLLAVADNVFKLHAICQVCGGEASRTQRLVDGRPAAWDDPTILIGAAESYEARCRRCHQVRKIPRGYRTAANRSPVPSTYHENPRPRLTAAPVHNGNYGQSARNGNAAQYEHAESARPEEDNSQLEMFNDQDQ